MDRKKLLKRLIHLIFLIFIVNFLADKFYWYSDVWWFDMPMHFLGGFWLGLLGFYLFGESFKLSPEPKALIVKILLFVFLIGVGWELFEIIVNDVITKNSFNTLDTFSDIFFDLSGGTAAILYFLRRIMLQSQNGTNS